MNLPDKGDLIQALKILKTEIADDYRASEEDHLPSMQVTIGWNEDGGWSYQTGDNSFMGSAYHYPHWAVVSLYRRSNCTELAENIIEQLEDLASW